VTKNYELILGDCIDAMRQMPPESVEAVICDPPYGISFMQEKWDDLSEVKNANRGTLTNMVNEDGSQKFRNKAPAFDLSITGARAMQDWHFAWAKEALRVLKPGGHLLAFGGCRTFHRLACAIEDAGFELRDCVLAWVFGSGFPKSMSIDKAIDKQAGVEREVVGYDASRARPNRANKTGPVLGNVPYDRSDNGATKTAPASDAARQWAGYGTALKPAFEPVCVARKPISEKTVAANVLKHGTGAINIDACRIGTEKRVPGSASKDNSGVNGGYGYRTKSSDDSGQNPNIGRWPANFTLVHLEGCQKIGTKKVKGSKLDHECTKDSNVYGKYETQHRQGHTDATGHEEVDEWRCVEGCPVRELDRQSGELKSGMMAAGQQRQESKGEGGYHGGFPDTATQKDTFGDSGGASRFFYTAKASPDEKWFLCRTCNEVGKQAIYKKNPDCPIHGSNPQTKDFGPLFGGKPDTKCACWGNAVDAHKDHDTVIHPTVKPTEICRWLTRLVLGKGGTVLDPFAGTGTMGVAALAEGFKYIGIEKDPDYFKIASKRIETEGR
jgi:site-specific DNA-methyltransferase (adenine-specific)